MKHILVVGAGGHGRVVADILLRMRDTNKAFVPVGYLDDNENLRGKLYLGLPVFGSLEDICASFGGI